MLTSEPATIFRGEWDWKDLGGLDGRNVVRNRRVGGGTHSGYRSSWLSVLGAALKSCLSWEAWVTAWACSAPLSSHVSFQLR